MEKLADYVNILDSQRIPLSAKERTVKKKIYPYYGAQGIIDYVDDFIFDGEYILVAEDGENLRSLKQNIATFVTGKFWVNNHAHILAETEKASLKYIYYLLNSMDLRRYVTGSAQPKLNQANLANIEISIPPIETQRKIGDFLYTIDKKIEVNKKINATLEERAKTIYLYYFFKKPANATLGDIIVENPKSSIPVGEVKNVKGEYPFFTSGDSVLQWTEALVDGRNIFMNTGGNSGVKFFVGKAAYSTDTWCITAKNNLADYLYLFLKVIQVEINKKFFAGTALKHLQKDLLKMREIYIPTETELEKFNADIQPGFTMISNNLMENRKLAEYRDFLLPMLMNGQATIK